MATKYQEQIDDALESIQEAGVQLDAELFTKAKDNSKPWNSTNTSNATKLWCVILPVDNAPEKLRNTYFKQGSMIEEEYRFILAAGEGRTTHPKTGDIIKGVEGIDATVMANSPLTVDGAAAILYEMVVKL